MTTLPNLLKDLCSAVGCIRHVLHYALTFLWALICPRAVLAARLLAGESQLAVCKDRIQENKDPRPRFSADFRLLWVILSKFPDAWEEWAKVMRPATVKRWHRTAFRWFWR